MRCLRGFTGEVDVVLKVWTAEEWRLPQLYVRRWRGFMEWRDDLREVVSRMICNGCTREERTEGDRRWRWRWRFNECDNGHQIDIKRFMRKRRRLGHGFCFHPEEEGSLGVEVKTTVFRGGGLCDVWEKKWFCCGRGFEEINIQSFQFSFFVFFLEKGFFSFFFWFFLSFWVEVKHIPSYFLILFFSSQRTVGVGTVWLCVLS